MKDILFLKANCIESSKVMAEIDFNAVLEDSFRGKSGQELLVMFSYSGATCDELRRVYNVKAGFPFILSHDGAVVEKVKNVIMYLRREKMTKG